MTWITPACFCVVLMVVCSAVEEKYVTIIRSSRAPEHFSYSRSKDNDKFPSSCTSFNGSSILTSGSTQDCTCKSTEETFAYSDNKWSCVGPNLYAAQNISGSASCRLRYGNGEWIPTVKKREVPWTKIDNLSRDDGQCDIVWRASSVLRCSNIMVPILTKPTYQFYSSQRQYGLSIFNFPKEMEGRIIKIAFRCKKHAHPEANHCLMLKVEGQIKCPFMHHIKSTTRNIVTSSFLSSTAKINTKVTEHPTTKDEAKNKKPTKGSRGSVPIPAIAGGIAAALISVIVIIVFLACMRKRMRKNEKFGNQDLNGHLHQYENEPQENGFVHQTTLQPSCVVQTEEATSDYVIPCQTKNSEMSSKENSVAAGSNPSCPSAESESVWGYENIYHPYQELQNKPWNNENCDYAKLVFKKRNQSLNPMQDS